MNEENDPIVPVQLADLQLVVGRLRDLYDVAEAPMPDALKAALDALDAAMDGCTPE